MQASLIYVGALFLQVVSEFGQTEITNLIHGSINEVNFKT